MLNNVSEEILKASNLNLKIEPAVIKELRNFLIFEEYDEIYKILRGSPYFTNPWHDLNKFERSIRLLNQNKELIYQLFFLGKNVSYARAIHFMGKDLIDSLIKINFFHLENNSVGMNGLAIVPYRNFFFLVSLSHVSPNSIKRPQEAYLGADSYVCSHFHLNCNAKDTILDLCCGTGFQMILGSRDCYSCIGVEITPFAKNVCKFNLILNEVQDKIKVRLGNLYDPVKTKKFSIIYANPPFLPIPKGIDYTIAGDGGEDGAKILKRIYEKMDNFLLDQGRSLVYCETLGNSKTIFFLDWLKEISQKYNWRTEIFVLGKVYYLEQIRRIVGLTTAMNQRLEEKSKELTEAWLMSYKKMKKEIEFMYSLIIKIYKSAPIKKKFTINNFFKSI